MKKILVFIFLMLFLTGCSAEYTINIDNNYTETLKSYPETKLESESMSKYASYRDPAFYDPYYAEDELTEYPQMERYSTSFDGKVHIYTYTFKKQYEKSNIVNSSASNFVVGRSENSYVVARDVRKIFNSYSGLKTIKINIITSKEVYSNNADSISGNTYTWIITRDNPNREVSLYYYDKDYHYDENSNNNGHNVKPDNKNNNSSNEPKKSIKSSTLLYILYSLFFALIFVIIVFRKKFRR